MTREVSAIILAGGQSRRMGHDKALLDIDGETLLARTVRTVQGVTDQIMVVGRTVLPQDCPSVRTVADARPGMGPLGGLCIGLRQTSATHVICVGCDFPCLQADCLTALIELLDGWDAVVPVAGEREHYLHAVYHRRILACLEERAAAGDRSMRGGLRGLRLRLVSEEELQVLGCAPTSMTNVNTPDEWDAIRGRARSRGYSSP